VHLFVLLREVKNLSETFLILRRIQRDVIMNAHTSEYKVFIILTRIFMKFVFSLNIFKNTKIKIFKNMRPVAAQSFQADGPTGRQMERHDEAGGRFSKIC